LFVFEQILSLFLLFCLGLVGRHFSFFTAQDARTLSKVVIYLTLPAVTFVALSSSSIQLEGLLILCLLGALIPFLVVGLSLLASRHLDLPRRTLAVFLCSAPVANLGYFLFPFFDLMYGAPGLAHLVAFDIGNMIVAYTVPYYIALRFSDKGSPRVEENLKEIFKFPPLWAAVLGLLFGILSRRFSLTLPDLMTQTLTLVGQANSLLAMLILGIHFRFQIRYTAATAIAVTIRMFGGLVVGMGLAHLLGLEGMARTVVVMAPGMPVGLTTLIYAVRFDLDADWAASLIGISVVVGFVVIFLFTQFLL
jgi:predicted permease